MRKKRIIRVVLLAFIVVWMLTVFGLSNQSGDDSSGLSQRIAALFSADERIISIIEPYIRKLAHLSEYAARRHIVFASISNLRFFR